MLVTNIMSALLFWQCFMVNFSPLFTPPKSHLSDFDGMNFGMVAIICFPNFLFGTEIKMSQINHRLVGVWDGNRSKPTSFDPHPNTIPPGGVVQNCPKIQKKSFWCCLADRRQQPGAEITISSKQLVPTNLAKIKKNKKNNLCRHLGNKKR